MAVVGNRIYTQGQEGDQQFVVALDTAGGKQVWKTPTGKAFSSDQGGGPRGMPTVDAKRLYALAADGTLVCLDTETGKRLWGFNYVEKFGSTQPRWAFSASALVDGDRLIISPGGKGAGIVALNKATGDVIWQSQDDLAGYSSVLPLDFGGLHIYTVMTRSAAIGVDAKDGSLLWLRESGEPRRQYCDASVCGRVCVLLDRLRYRLRSAKTLGRGRQGHGYGRVL
jgi:outer membrane protein assembly factor BamB